MKPVILLVDDEDTIRLFLEKTLREEGYEALTAATGTEALERTRSELPDLVLLDLKLPDMSGLDVLKQIKEEVPEVCVIMLTAFGDIETAVTAMKVIQGGMPKMLIAAVIPMYSVIRVSQFIMSRSVRENQPQTGPKLSKIASA